MSSTSPPSLYTNLALHGRQIRLFEIISTKPEITCKLEVANLEDALLYSALSYVWGDPAITKSILVNGRRLEVTANLASALEHATHHMEGAKVAPVLWADALCVNQIDLVDKSHQVSLMKDIYSQAELVICWLGPPDDAIHRAMDWIHIIARECAFPDADEELHASLCRVERQQHAVRADFGKRVDLQRHADPEGTIVIDFDPLIESAQAVHDFVASVLSAPDSIKFMDQDSIPRLRTCVDYLQQFSGLPASNSAEEATMDIFKTVVSQLYVDLDKLAAQEAEMSHSKNLGWLDKYPSFYDGIGYDENGARDLWNLIGLPYWNRVWVFQEMVLAKRPIFACGLRSLSLDPLDQLTCWTRWLATGLSIAKPRCSSTMAWEVIRQCCNDVYLLFERRFEARRVVGQPTPLCLKARGQHARPGQCSELHWRNPLSATRPKDHFYGFLSLSCRDLVPDYSPNTSVGTVCRDFMVEYVRASRFGSLDTRPGELNLLDFAGIGHGWDAYPDMPSWAPNYPGFEQRHEKGWPVLAGFSNDVNVLFSGRARVVGSDMFNDAFLLDTVQELGPVRREFGNASAWDEPGRTTTWAMAFAMSQQEYVTGCHPLAALHSLLHCELAQTSSGQGFGSRLANPSLDNAIHLVHWLWMKCEKIGYDGDSDVDIHQFCKMMEYLQEALGESVLHAPSVKEECNRLFSSCSDKNQRIAETQHGYLGIFPLHVQSGDVVCVMNGLHHPAVLRKAGDHYVFVGTCFVQGLGSRKQVEEMVEKVGKQAETSVIR